MNINAGEHRRDNHNEQPRETGQHKGTQDEEKQNKKQYVLNISIRRHKYRKQDMNPPINNRREHRFYAESVTDITTRNSESYGVWNKRSNLPKNRSKQCTVEVKKIRLPIHYNENSVLCYDNLK